MKPRSYQINLLLLLLMVVGSASFAPAPSTHSGFLPAPPKIPCPLKDYALFFAVSDYEQWPDLQNPIKDAEDIASDLEKLYGFNKPEIVRDPTYAQVIETLNRYSTDIKYADDAQLFIFFTGHGLLNSVNEGFFVPKDGRKDDPSQQSYLLHARIANLVNNIPCKHILLGIDACYSGSFMRTIRPKGMPGERPGVTEKTKKDVLIADMLQYKSRLVITSGGEVPTNDNSQFARQILAALRSRGGESGIVDFYSLVGYLQSARPTPRFGEFGDSDPGAQFLLVYSGPPPAADTDEPDWQKALSSGNFRQYIKDHPAGHHLDEALDNIQSAGNNRPDKDGDGIKDGDDKCPEAKGTVIAGGCPDRDGDGVADKDDACPDRAGDSIHKGCPDTDKDGIYDDEDRCPDKPGIAALRGCPEIKKEDKAKLERAFKLVKFETGKNVLLAESLPVLDEIVSIMKQYSEYSLHISGHTDNQGDSKLNQDISERRAYLCYSYLVSKGIAGSRMTHAGYGETRPVADNSTSVGRDQNRRVEFELYVK